MRSSVLLILIGILVQALITIYINPLPTEESTDKGMMSEIQKLPETTTTKEDVEDPSTIQNKFMVGYQGW
jgi:hypothetical protein